MGNEFTAVLSLLVLAGTLVVAYKTCYLPEKKKLDEMRKKKREREEREKEAKQDKKYQEKQDELARALERKIEILAKSISNDAVKAVHLEDAKWRDKNGKPIEPMKDIFFSEEHSEEKQRNKEAYKMEAGALVTNRYCPRDKYAERKAWYDREIKKWKERNS